MSTKFSKNSPVQKPPPVCKKPPDAPELPWPPLENQILIAYVHAYYPVHTPPFLFTAHLPIWPTVPNTWEGISNNPGIHNVKVLVVFDPAAMTVDVELQLRQNSAPIKTVTFPNLHVPQPNKFSTRLAEVFDKTLSTRFQTQILA
jgi:hypothetical protein